MPCPPACLSRSRKCWNRRPRIGCRGASTGCPRNPGCHWAIPGKPLSATERPASATGPTGPRPMRRARRQCPGLWTTGHRENSRHARHWTPPGGAGRSVLFGPAYRLAQSLPRRKPGISSPPRATPALPRQLRKLDGFDFLLIDDLGYLLQGAPWIEPKNLKCSSPS